MRNIAWLTVLALVGLVRADDKKGTVVELDGMKSTTPSTWVSERPINNFRFMQFRVPKVEGDSDDAEIVLSKGQSGSTKDNLERWKKSFVAPEGKKIDDVAKEGKARVGKFEGNLLQIEGSYRSFERPGDPSSKLTLKPNFKFDGIIVETKNEVFYIRFTGPAKTIEKNEKAFMDWLKSFE
jgi:hypothetical protein